MSSPRASSARVLDSALSQLAAGAKIAHSGRFRLMVGTGGVFVLRPLEQKENAAEAIDEVEHLASLTRDRIAQHMAWVPFVDWFVVSDEPRIDCTVLPSDLIGVTAFERDSLQAETVTELGELIDGGNLSPLWHKGIPAAWERPADPMATDAPTAF